jgi:hypothetical protein
MLDVDMLLSNQEGTVRSNTGCSHCSSDQTQGINQSAVVGLRERAVCSAGRAETFDLYASRSASRKGTRALKTRTFHQMFGKQNTNAL